MARKELLLSSLNTRSEDNNPNNNDIYWNPSLARGVKMTPIYKGCWSGRMFKGPSPSWLYQKNIDWQVRPKSTPEENTRATLYIKENAAYCERCWSCCCPGSRSTEYTTYEGANDSGRKLYKFSKFCTLSPRCVVCMHQQGFVRCSCCCCLPYLNVYDMENKKIGSATYECTPYCFVPTFGAYDGAGVPKFVVRPDTCCGGQCPSNFAKDGFYYRDYKTWEKLSGDNNFESFDNSMKATVLAIVVLQSMTLIEATQNYFLLDCGCAPQLCCCCDIRNTEIAN